MLRIQETGWGTGSSHSVSLICLSWSLKVPSRGSVVNCQGHIASFLIAFSPLSQDNSHVTLEWGCEAGKFSSDNYWYENSSTSSKPPREIYGGQEACEQTAVE